MPGDRPILRIETLSTLLAVGGEGFYRLFVDGKEYAGLTPKPVWTIEEDPVFPWKAVRASAGDVGVLRAGPTANSISFNSKRPRPKVPSFFLKAKYKLSETSVRVRFMVEWPETYPYLSNEDLTWITPAGERAAQVMLALMDNIPAFLREAIGRVKIVRIPTPPQSGRSLADFTTRRSTGEAVQVYDGTVAKLTGRTQTPDGADRLLAYVFLHEFAHALMSARCGEPFEKFMRHWLTSMNEWARWATTTVIGIPAGMLVAIPPLLTGLFFSEHDFMSEWSKASGWVINDGQGVPLLGYLLWDKYTKPPNWVAAHGDIGKPLGLRNVRLNRAAYDASINKRERALKEFKRSVDAYNAAGKAYDSGVAASLPADQLLLLNDKMKAAEAIMNAAQKALEAADAEIERLVRKSGLISWYSAETPHEDWAETISQPLTSVPPRPLKDPARIEFLKKCRLLPPNKPVDISHWLGFVVVWKLEQPHDPATTRKRTRVVKKKPVREVSAAEFARAVETAAEPEPPKTSAEKSPLSEFAKNFYDGPLVAAIKANREVFAQIAAGMSESTTIDLLRNVELRGDGWRAYGGVGHKTSVGDLVVGADRNPWAVMGTDARGHITQIFGDVPLTEKTREKDLLISADTIAIHWRPSSEPRTWSRSGNVGKTWKDIDASMKQLIGLWGRETSEVSKRDLSTSSGFFLEVLDAAGLADATHSLTDSCSFERVLGFCAAHGEGLLMAEAKGAEWRTGDVVLSTKLGAVGVITRPPVREEPADLLVGGIKKTGPIGETEFEVKLLHGTAAADFDFLWSPSGKELALGDSIAGFYGSPSSLQRLTAKVGGDVHTEERRVSGERLTLYHNEPYDLARLLADAAPKKLRDQIWQAETFQQLREVVGRLPGGLKPYAAGQALSRGTWLFLAPSRFGVVLSTTAEGAPATILTHGDFALAIEAVEARALRGFWIPTT